MYRSPSRPGCRGRWVVAGGRGPERAEGHRAQAAEAAESSHCRVAAGSGRHRAWAARARSAIATASYVVWVRGLFGLLVLGGLVALDGRERERGG